MGGGGAPLITKCARGKSYPTYAPVCPLKTLSNAVTAPPFVIVLCLTLN